MTPHETAIFFAGCAAGVFVLTPIAVWRITAKLKVQLMATASAAASAIETAAQAMTAAAQELSASAQAIGNANLTTLDQPLSDLAAGVTAVQNAAAAVKTAAGG